MMNHRLSLVRVVERQEETIRLSSSLGGIVLQSFSSNFGVIQLLLICGVLGRFTNPHSNGLSSNKHRCVFGEMFRGKPILAGNSDLNQAQLIFNLVGTPSEENMPGWSSLPGCEGVKSFGFKPGNLHQVFREYVQSNPSFS